MRLLPHILIHNKFMMGFLFLCTCFCAHAQNNKQQTKSNTQQSQNNTIQFQNSTNELNTSQSYSKLKRYNFSFAASYLDSAKYYSDKNSLRAVDFINKAIEQSITENDKTTESASYLILGNLQQRLQQHDLAIENYKKCINVYAVANKKVFNSSSNGDPYTLFNANKQMAISYMELNDLDKALSKINNCWSFLSVSQADMLSAKRILAAIKLKQMQPKESISILNDALVQENLINDIPGEVETNIALGEIYQDQKNDEKAIEYYTRAKTIAEKNNQSRLTLKANDLLAKIFRKQKNITKELETRNSNIAINIDNNNSQGINKENIELGNAYLNANQMDVAQTYFDKGLTTNSLAQGTQLQTDKIDLFIQSNDLDETANTYKLLAEQYLKQKNPVKALDYFDKYAVLQDSIKHVRKRELDEALSISNSLGKNQQRIDLLEKERQLSEKSLQILKQDQDFKEEQLGFKNVIIGVLMFFLLFMLMAGYLMIRSSREKRRVNQLLALKSLRGQMNPHFIFNALNSVNHYISQNDERKANRYLSDFSKLMRMVMDSSKHSLVPLNEEMDMLKLYLQLEHARFNDKFDYTVDISENVSNSEFELPPMLIQPYLENAIWHGLRYLDHKGQLALFLEEQHHELVVSITDNGIGRNKSLELKTHNQKKQASIGMQNIENRIVIMNDLFGTNIRVEVTDAHPELANCGTKVKLYIPQQKHAHA
ncbi:MAG: histidine kinase [Bacteroidota bacterium]